MIDCQNDLNVNLIKEKIVLRCTPVATLIKSFVAELREAKQKLQRGE